MVVLGEPLAGWLATAAVGGSFLASVVVFLGLRGEGAEERAYELTLFEWMPVGGLHVDFGFLIDPLSITMCLFVTGIATLIHLYSIGYMHGDPRYPSYAALVSLFTGAMTLVLAAAGYVWQRSRARTRT